MIYRIRVDTIVGDEPDDILVDRAVVEVADKDDESEFTEAVSVTVGRKFDINMNQVVEMAVAALKNPFGAG